MIKRRDLLSLDVTLQCNLMCVGCNKFVSPVGYGYMMGTDEFTAVMDYVIPDTTATYIRLIGGEPLLHPDIILFSDIIEDRGLGVEIATNGVLLNRFDEKWLYGLHSIKITDYGDRNRQAVDKYAPWPNVTIIKSMESWRDPGEEANITMSEIDGLIAYKRCPMGTIKVCDWKVWDCCAAEAVERRYELPDTSARLGDLWLSELDKKSRASTCRRCYFGLDTINNLRKSGEYELEKSRL